MFLVDLESSDIEMSPRPFLNEGEFIQKYRMSREKFAKLLSLIDSHDVFINHGNGPQQAPPAFQLMVFLKYIGTEGSGSSNLDLRNLFRTGRGTNDLFKKRVVKAICSLQSTYYTWPTEQDHSFLTQFFGRKWIVQLIEQLTGWMEYWVEQLVLLEYWVEEQEVGCRTPLLGMMSSSLLSSSIP